MTSLLLIISLILSAQSDRIVGVVDREAITLAEVDEKLKLSGMPITQETRRQTLEAMIQTKLLLIAAERETLFVHDEDIKSALEHRINTLKENFPQEELFYSELERLNMTVEELKNLYREDIEASMVVRMLIQKRFGNLSVSDISALHFYNSHPDSIPPIPTTAIYRGVLIPIIPGEETLKEKERLIKRIEEKLLMGEDFTRLVAIYSDDPITRKNQGRLGIMEIDEIDPELRDMSEGDIRLLQKGSAIHILLCEMRTENRISLRTIVFDLTPTTEDTIKAYKLADKVKLDIEDGNIIRDDRRIMILSDGVEYLPLPPLFEDIGLDSTQILSTPDGLYVVRIFDKREGRHPEFEEVRENLKLFLQQRKIEERVSSLLSRLEEEIFVERRI
ncbi:peptidylprolyl isomerase [candidate division WOR-3 bacterium]|nr:peptidylprolyl isomerase [candidate division WOR-3 bacterium]